MAEAQFHSDELTLNLGPQHPSTHGVLRLILRINGEYITSVTPDLGYLHRGVEKLAEERTFLQFMPLTDRFDYLASMFNNAVYAMAVEEIGQIEVPERAEYIRVIVMELNRIASHLMFFGAFGLDVGALTPILYAFRDRERVLELLEIVSGARLTYNYMRFGGVRQDLPPGFDKKCLAFMHELPDRIAEYHNLLTGNEIFLIRTKGIAPLNAERAVAAGVTGPMLRASGVAHDLRRARPYSVYHKFDFNIPTYTNGDTFDRFVTRLDEILQSIRIVEQAVAGLPEGPHINPKAPKILKLPAGDVYTCIESPRGELGVYLATTGDKNPYRFHLRPPSLSNLFILEELCNGMKIGDLIAILGSIDIVLGDIDR